MVAPPRTAAATIVAGTDPSSGEVNSHAPVAEVRSADPAAAPRAGPEIRTVAGSRAAPIGLVVTSNLHAVTGRAGATGSRRPGEPAETIARRATIGHRVSAAASVMIGDRVVMIVRRVTTGHPVSTAVSSVMTGPRAVMIGRRVTIGHLVSTAVSVMIGPRAVMIGWRAMTGRPVSTGAGVMIGPRAERIARTGSVDRANARTTRTGAGTVVTGARTPTGRIAIGVAPSAAT